MSIATAEQPAAVDYHSRPEISRSMLAKFDKSPRLYEALYVTRTIRDDFESDAMAIGTLTHQQLLEPHILDNFMVIPRDVLTSNGQRRGKAWEQFEADHSDKVLLLERDYKTTQMAVEAVRKSIGALIDNQNAEREKEIYWDCPYTGLKRRSKLDLVIPTKMGLHVIDIKTCADLSRFNWQIKDGLWLQYADYRCAVHEEFNEWPTFFFCVVEKSEPYRIRNVKLDEPSTIQADTRHAKLMHKLHDALLTNDFSEEGENEIIELSIPF